MDNDFGVFRNFPTKQQAKELEALLQEHGIETIFADNIPPVDITFSGNTLQNQYEIRIALADFKKAELILEEATETETEQVDPDYYLFGFTNEELYEILLKADEWNAFDYKLAQKLLQKRGKPVDKDLLNALKQERLKLLAEPEENQKIWIILGYAMAFIGGLLGVIIGYCLWTNQKSLPNGKKVYSYSEADRMQGKYIFIIGAILLPIYVFLRLRMKF